MGFSEGVMVSSSARVQCLFPHTLEVAFGCVTEETKVRLAMGLSWLPHRSVASVGLLRPISSLFSQTYPGPLIRADSRCHPKEAVTNQIVEDKTNVFKSTNMVENGKNGGNWPSFSQK